MKQRKILLPLMATIALTATGYIGIQSFFHSEDEYSSLVMQNIEALSDPEGGKGYSISPYDCVITGIGQIKLGNGKIIKASADGSISLSGARDCKLNGDFLCNPISCDQLYSTIF